MKIFRTTTFLFMALFLSLLAFGQQMTLTQWNEEAKSNIRLLPKYGHAQKTEGQKRSDREFIETALKLDSTVEKAFNHSIDLGFNYLYRDIKTAMYRFNQAYLIDSNNTDIYWGFGAVYMTLGDYGRAKTQYEEGLEINPNSTHLLTDYATYFMTQYYDMEALNETVALKHLESALAYLQKSYNLDSKDPNTTFKLSVCYMLKADCENAWKFHNLCKELGGQPITEEYTADLKKKCN